MKISTISTRYIDGTSTAAERNRVPVPEMLATWHFATKNDGERPHGATPG